MHSLSLSRSFRGSEGACAARYGGQQRLGWSRDLQFVLSTPGEDFHSGRTVSQSASAGRPKIACISRCGTTSHFGVRREMASRTIQRPMKSEKIIPSR